MSMQATIERKLSEGLTVEHLEVMNESGNHNVPPGSESHFKVVVVSDDFEGHGLVSRHQLVYRLLSEEMKKGIHALALHTYTSGDWAQKAPQLMESPPCLGGGKSVRN